MHCELRFCVHKVSRDSLIDFRLIEEALLQPGPLLGVLRNIIESDFSADTGRPIHILMQLSQIVLVEVVTSRCIRIIQDTLCLEVLRGLELLDCRTIQDVVEKRRPSCLRRRRLKTIEHYFN